MPESFDATATRVVSLIGGSHFVHHAYLLLLPPIFVPLRSRIGLTDPQLGIALGTLGLVVTVLQLPYGHLSDSRSRTAVLALSHGFGAAGALLTALAWDFPSLVASQVVLGIGVAAHHPAHYPLLSAVTTTGTRGRAYSVHGFAGVLGYAAPPAVVATTATLGFGWRPAIGVIAAVGAIYGTAATLAIRGFGRSITHPPTSNRDESEDPTAVGGRLFGGLRSLLSSRPIVALTVLWFVTSIAAWGIKQYTGTLLADGYGLDLAAANFSVSAMFVAGAVLVLAGGWLTDRHSPVAVMLGGYGALVAVAGLLASRIVPVIAAVALVAILSGTIDSSRPARAALADRFSTADSVGKNFGLLTIGISAGAVVAPPLFGVVVARAGIGVGFAVIATIGVLCAVLTLLVLSLNGTTAAVGETLAD